MVGLSPSVSALRLALKAMGHGELLRHGRARHPARRRGFSKGWVECFGAGLGARKMKRLVWIAVAIALIWCGYGLAEHWFSGEAARPFVWALAASSICFAFIIALDKARAR